MKRPIPFLELASMHADLSDELIRKFADVLKNGVFSAGEEVNLLESQMTGYLKIPHAVACANGTDALELALRALEIGPGDEVIVPALTWVSTAEVVRIVGAQVVFADVDASGLLDAGLMDNLVTSRTKAVVPVHLYGKMVDMRRLMSWAKERDIWVVEDAAQALGAFQKGISAGCYGDIGCYSFYPTKNLGAMGEAGMVVTSEEKWSHQLQLLRNHGQTQRDEHETVGRNSRIDTLQAAFLNVKWPYFQSWQAKRKRLASIYMQELEHVHGLRIPQGINQEDHNAHLFTVQCDKRDFLKTYLENKGIGTAIHYPRALPDTSAFWQVGDFPMARRICQTTLSLPLHPYLKEQEVSRVCAAIRDFMALYY